MAQARQEKELKVANAAKRREETPFGVVGNKIRTASGKTFDIANPTIDMVSIEDIAHALSRICRFGGHIREGFYSVAEHCVHCVDLANEYDESYDIQLAVLLHDATEAYLGDVIKPLKIMLPDYQAIEKRVETIIAAAFGVNFDLHHKAIKVYDHSLLVHEKNAFLRDANTFTFEGERNVAKFDRGFDPLSLKPEAARVMFLNAYHDLTKRAEAA